MPRVVYCPEAVVLILVVGSMADKVHSYIILVALSRRRKNIKAPKVYVSLASVNSYLKRSMNGKLPIYHSWQSHLLFISNIISTIM